MANNDIPKSNAALSNLAERLYNGLNALGEALDLTITPEAFQAKLTAYTAAETAYNAARTSLQTASAAFTNADAALATWIGKVRSALVPHLGAFWSTAWVPTGFTAPSTSTPATCMGRMLVAGMMTDYLTANPTYEVAATGVTPAVATAQNTAITTTQMQVDAARTFAGTKKAVRDMTAEALRAIMRSVIRFLDGTLSKTDPRWETFGLNIPATRTTPGAPQNVIATGLPGGTILAQCDATPLATRYRWRLRVNGVQQEFSLAASTPAPMAEIHGVEPGQTVDLYVQAVNGNSQGVASETVRVILPVVAPTAAFALETKVASSNGNGAHGGHGHARELAPVAELEPRGSGAS